MNKEEIIKGALFAEFLNQNGVETGVDVDEILDKITGETMEEKSNEMCGNKYKKNVSDVK